MFSRNKSADNGNAAAADDGDALAAAESIEAGSPKKGRPTPKRKEAEAKNVRPLVPTDRRAAAQDARAQQRAARDRQFKAMQSGDERYMPAKDKGPQRRYVRDYVDARWNLGEFFLGIALVFIVLTMLTRRYPAMSLVIILLLYAIVLGTVVDAFIMWRKLKKKLIAKFGDVERGTVMYAVTRAFQLRRARLPKPSHPKHGHYPS